eukprot:CAMPEP_0170362412 /NCGR_PEP_ID=MMETSP0117_2-20130122/4319_1 /TAXON_ID=400756 /ORGANISM="Durinskia baltica, Strain CSIRO CS-38" /LENGTH=653 /DNA_ID=CAMNT_0010616829 /DNA_START=72 /DNA_END=2030 /DNA_ORIENTATION=-
MTRSSSSPPTSQSNPATSAPPQRASTAPSRASSQSRYFTRRSVVPSTTLASDQRIDHRTFRQVVKEGVSSRGDRSPVQVSQPVPVVPSDLIRSSDANGSPFTEVVSRKKRKSVFSACKTLPTLSEFEVCSVNSFDDDIIESDDGVGPDTWQHHPDIHELPKPVLKLEPSQMAPSSPSKRKKASPSKRSYQKKITDDWTKPSSFRDYLQSSDLHMAPSFRDGRCLFGSMATALGLPFSREAADAVRLSIMNYAVSRPERAEVLWKSEPDVSSLHEWYSKYVVPSEWGGHPHVLLFEELFNTRFEIYRDDVFPFGPSQFGAHSYPTVELPSRSAVFVDGNHYAPLVSASSDPTPIQFGRADVAAFRRQPSHPGFQCDHEGRPWHTVPEEVLAPLRPFFTSPVIMSPPGPSKDVPGNSFSPLPPNIPMISPARSTPFMTASPGVAPTTTALSLTLMGARFPMSPSSKPAFQARCPLEPALAAALRLTDRAPRVDDLVVVPFVEGVMDQDAPTDWSDLQRFSLAVYRVDADTSSGLAVSLQSRIYQPPRVNLPSPPPTGVLPGKSHWFLSYANPFAVQLVQQYVQETTDKPTASTKMYLDTFSNSHVIATHNMSKTIEQFAIINVFGGPVRMSQLLERKGYVAHNYTTDNFIIGAEW